MLVGGLVLIGWWSGNEALKQLIPGLVVMKANTAAAFVLAGLALWLLHENHPRRHSILRQVCSSLVLLTGLITLIEYLLGWGPGFDQLLFREVLEPGGVAPGRMTAGSALSFVLMGAALLLRADLRRTRLAQIVTVPLLLLALVPIIGYVFGADSLFRAGSSTAVVLPSAIVFCILGLGLNFVRPEEGGMAVLLSQGAAGFLARNLLPAAILLPIMTGWLNHLTESSGRFEEAVVEAVAVVINVVLLTGVLVWAILTLQRVDLARLRADDEIYRLTQQLEERVLRRTAQLAEVNQLVEEERDQLQILMDNIPDSIYFKDAASRFTRVNRAQARILGLDDPQQAVGKADAYFFAADAAAAAQTDEQRLIRTGESIIDRREMNPTPDGRERWFSSTKVPILDQHGKVSGLVGISRDVTKYILNEKAAERANARLSGQVNQMAMIIELNEELQACAVDEEVYQVAARMASRVFPEALGALYSIDPIQQSVMTAVTWGTPPLEKQTFEIDDCWALRRGKPHRSGGTHSSEPCKHLGDSPPTFSICLPLWAAGERLGMLHLRAAPGTEQGDFSEIQVQSAHLTADGLALAWSNVRLRESLHEQAVRDPLTGLFNRRHMQASLERELRRAERIAKPIGIMMLDIDHFKEVNDTHGHDAGDVVLRELGRFLNEHTRGGDIACRLGGEEFIIVLPEATLEQTRARAETHRQGFTAVRIESSGGRIETPTLSIGVAAYPVHGTTAEDLLRAADAALYRAKTAGRDRVVAAE
jgi:diguanylate cyclase (GGDEF)-like protein/PAS domain S-box-containing protein